MRVNIYAEEMTDRVEVISKVIDGVEYTGVRFYLELPITVYRAGYSQNLRGPFLHRPGDDDSSAVTFWGKKDLRKVLEKALALLTPTQPEPVTPADTDRINFLEKQGLTWWGGSNRAFSVSIGGSVLSNPRDETFCHATLRAAIDAAMAEDQKPPEAAKAL